MNKVVIVLVCLGMLFGLTGCSPAVQTDAPKIEEVPVVQEVVEAETNVSEEPKIYPSVVIDPAVVLLDRNQVLVISGAGFPPDQEVVLRTLGKDKGFTDITFLWGEPVTDEFGTFTASAKLDRMTTILEPGVYPLWVITEDLTVVVPLVYIKE